MGELGLPVEQRRFGTDDDALRPPLIQLWECERVLLEGVTMRNSPFWTIHPVYCRDVVVRDLTIRGTGPNTDGIDPDSCERVRIERCDIATDDDAIAIKSGRDADGRRVNRPTRDVVISNCKFSGGHAGVAIGSEMSGDVSDVTITDCVCVATNTGILIKTQRGRGGVVENVLAQRIQMKDVKRDGLMISMHYNAVEPEPLSERTPTIRNVTFSDIEGSCELRAGRIIGLTERDVSRVRLERVSLDARDGFACRWAADVEMKDVSFSVKKGPPVECADSHDIRINGETATTTVTTNPATESD
jgi:polygalacturonase